MKNLLIVLCLTFTWCASAQEARLHASDNKVYIIKNGIKLDSLGPANYDRKNQFVRIRENRVYMFAHIAAATGDPLDDHTLISEYTIANDKFVLAASIPLFTEGCEKPIKFRLRKKGIKWSYNKGFLRKRKDLISYDEFRNISSYKIKCRGL